MHIGESGRIATVHDSPFSQRLIEMGCVPGTLLTLEISAPGGDPLAFYVDGYMLALRKKEARTIELVTEKNG